MKRLAVALVLLALVVAGTGQVLASEEGTLLIWADEIRSKVLAGISEDFEAEFGVPVRIQELPFTDIANNLAVAAPAGEGPDILVTAHDGLGKLVANGLLEPMDLGAKAKEFVPTALEAWTYDGVLYGLPYATEAIGLYYNKDLVDHAPTSFADLESLAKKATDRAKGSYGFALPIPDPYHTFPLMSALGGYVFRPSDNGGLNPLDIGLNNAGAVQGVALFDRLIEEGAMPVLDYSTMTGLFTTGKLAMMQTGPWELGNVRKAGINYGFVPIPPVAGHPARPFVGVQGFAISSFSKNKLLAQAFLNEYVATKETMLALFEQDPRPPAYLPALEEARKDPDVATVARAAADGIPMPAIRQMDAVWTAWGDALQLVANQELEPQQAMDDAVAQIRRTIEESMSQ
ncbi:sugar ABC transporter substrate-binding protein [Limnochorda pilosa]|uniref:Maltodextrin-binding protein n=1 Tax=Limnochorda pilosa TaxID=1555112 RepID=A0A0K2SJH4_LIMPI|nr:maltose ABC transporter substrate-binding protein [Limnochorda pilosa]BAS27009.1 sugar ABC transporter substrate-binding protein [Limnochorda pilosa]